MNSLLTAASAIDPMIIATLIVSGCWERMVLPLYSGFVTVHIKLCNRAVLILLTLHFARARKF